MSAERRLQVQRRHGPELCLLCRERVVEDRGADCPACGARYHKACLDSDRRCRSFGCAQQIRELAGPKPISARPQGAYTLAGILGAIHSILLVFLGSVFAIAFVGLVAWLIKFHRWPPQAIIATSLVIGAALVIKMARSEPI